MDNARGMGYSQGLGDLFAHMRDRRQRQALTLQCPQSPSLNELHDEKGLAGMIIDVIDRADVRMVQGGGGARFALEALQGSAVFCILGR